MPGPSWILIDGYNLLHASGVFGEHGRTSLESSREALLDWLGDVLSDAQRRRTTIVFDGRHAPPGLPANSRKHEIRVRFAPRRVEADDLIEQMIEDHSAPRSLVVVSSDRRIHRAAKRRKASPIDSDAWVATLQRGASRDPSDSKPHAEMDAGELEEWLDEFDVD